jgi:3-phenylpropionate/trans-cinnamate dioxygenase ferredoxin reductase component
MSQSSSRIVILGAGHAGGTAAALLRQYGHTGSITLIGEEPVAPYQRPPLSKAWLKGESDHDSLALKPAEFYAESGIDFRPGVSGVSLDRAAKMLTLSNGEELAYDTLILSTGARPIRLPTPGADLAGVLVLRTAADAEAIKAELGARKRVAIIGGGYIGLEVAASALLLGGSVVVIEREKRLLARSGSETIAEFFRRYHEARGARVMLGASVVGFDGEAGRVRSVRLADGESIDCDVALVGVGIRPNDEIAAQAGLTCARGVVVDLEARTSDSSIFAIGDAAHRPMPLYDRMFGPESVPNALEQAKQAASAITGRSPPAPEVPWNWSDQFDLKLQIAGLPFDVDRTLVRGDQSRAKFAVFHLKGQQIQQVEAVNAAPEFMAGKQFILNRRPVDLIKLADSTVSMKEVAA